MSNGDPPPDSGSSYIIICSGRIALQATDSREGKIVAASTCAARFAAFMSLQYVSDGGEYGQTIDDAIKPLAAIQHHLMVHFKDMNKHETEAKIQELFDCMSGIEGAY